MSNDLLKQLKQEIQDLEATSFALEVTLKESDKELKDVNEKKNVAQAQVAKLKGLLTNLFALYKTLETDSHRYKLWEERVENVVKETAKNEVLERLLELEIGVSRAFFKLKNPEISGQYVSEARDILDGIRRGGYRGMK